MLPVLHEAAFLGATVPLAHRSKPHPTPSSSSSLPSDSAQAPSPSSHHRLCAIVTAAHLPCPCSHSAMPVISLWTPSQVKRRKRFRPERALRERTPPHHLLTVGKTIQKELSVACSHLPVIWRSLYIGSKRICWIHCSTCAGSGERT